jgi:hypothetical protein
LIWITYRNNKRNAFKAFKLFETLNYLSCLLLWFSSLFTKCMQCWFCDEKRVELIMSDLVFHANSCK